MLALSMTAATTCFAEDGSSQPESLPIYPTPDMKVEYHTEWTKGHYPVKIREFMASPLATNDIVFIGDSITEKGGDWGKRFGSGRIRNRGIAGDVTAGVLMRLGEIYAYKPEAVFIMIGINDIAEAGKDKDFIAGNIAKIVSEIQKNSPTTKVCVQSILPNRKEEAATTARAVNNMLRQNAAKQKYTFIDLYKYFADDDKLLQNELTYDGTHLNEKGYQIWVDQEKKTIDELLGKTDKSPKDRP